MSELLGRYMVTLRRLAKGLGSFLEESVAFRETALRGLEKDGIAGAAKAGGPKGLRITVAKGPNPVIMRENWGRRHLFTLGILVGL